MSKLFLDTGYVIALEAEDDEHHQEARQHWRNLAQQRPSLVTTTYVFDEIVTFFNSRSRHAKAVEIGRRLLRSPHIRLVQVARERIREALCFDGHFDQAGFKRLPELPH